MDDKWMEAQNLRAELDTKRARLTLDKWDEVVAQEANERTARMAEVRANTAHYESAVALYDEQRAFWRATANESERQTEAFARIAVALERMVTPTITVGGHPQPPPVCTGSGYAIVREYGTTIARCGICGQDVLAVAGIAPTHAYRPEEGT